MNFISPIADLEYHHNYHHRHGVRLARYDHLKSLLFLQIALQGHPLATKELIKRVNNKLFCLMKSTLLI